MAAHIKTVLEQISERPEAHARFMKHGMGYAMFGDTMEPEDWSDLYNRLDGMSPDQIATEARALIPKYDEIWKKLNQPRNAEDWLRERIRQWRERNALPTD